MNPNLIALLIPRRLSVLNSPYPGFAIGAPYMRFNLSLSHGHLRTGQSPPRHHQQGTKTKVSGNAASHFNRGQGVSCETAGKAVGRRHASVFPNQMRHMIDRQLNRLSTYN